MLVVVGEVVVGEVVVVVEVVVMEVVVMVPLGQHCSKQFQAVSARTARTRLLADQWNG